MKKLQISFWILVFVLNCIFLNKEILNNDNFIIIIIQIVGVFCSCYCILSSFEE